MNNPPKAKCVLIGDMFVGKTSLSKCFVDGEFQEHYSVSCGGTFMAKTLKEPALILQIWDTAGMERFRSMLPHFLRDATCVLFVFDLSDNKTFLSIRDFWVDYVKQYAMEDKLMMVLIGNKLDKERQVRESDARGLADHYGMLYFETSAKTSQNIEKLFNKTAYKIMDVGAYRPKPKEDVLQRTEIVSNLAMTKKKFKCCLFS